MNSEKQKLIRDLLDDASESRRAETFLAGGRILRRRRYTRAAMRISAVALLACLSALWLQKRAGHSTTNQTLASATHPASNLEVRALTDDELLALFPNTPVGLATTADGKKRLIFPRPGDDQRFITRL